MKQYREKLRRQIWMTAAAAAVMAVITIFGFAAEAGLIHLQPLGGDSHYASAWRGFLSGAAFGVLAVMVFGLVKSIRALRNEEALKRAYVQEHDERQQKIWTSARAEATRAFLLTGAAAGVAAGYFSPVVGVTILACITLHALLCLIFKCYYSRKY
ncbi:MAG TPA: hypothetical protein IAC31_04725 [Candidatus Faecousia intestinigallinarum]|nr:hypothetical protein [Candidatus Faecousia intestinigallinarum]